MTAIRVRQVVFAVEDLEARAQEAAEAGLPFVWVDPDVSSFGARNSLHAAGDTFVELLAEATPGSAVGRHLDRLGGDGGYMVIVQVDDLDHHLDLARSAGVRIVWEGGRDGIRGAHLHPSDVGGAIVSLDQVEPREAWPWCGPAWIGGAPPTSGPPISGIRVSAAEPAAMAAAWAQVLDTPVDGHRIRLGGTDIEFVPADDRPDRLVGVTIEGHEPRVLAGVEISG